MIKYASFSLPKSFCAFVLYQPPQNYSNCTDVKDCILYTAQQPFTAVICLSREKKNIFLDHKHF